MTLSRVGRRPDRWTTRRVGLAVRLFLATGLVILAGAGTVLIVALLLAPPLFHEHLQRAGVLPVAVEARAHVDEAFGRSLLVSLIIGVAVAALTAGAISWLMSRRLAAPVQDIARAAQRLADGQYDAVVPDPRLGPEFTTLARAVNQLSGRLADAESTRRRLTADLAHQLRTPLASVAATVEALSDGVLTADAQTLATLTDQTSRLRRLVADLERVSRAEERQLLLRPCRQPLGPLVERCVAAITDRYHAQGVALTVQADPTTTAVRVDADRIVEALTNLLDNALRHSRPGGQVSVTVARAQVEVRDDGQGFDPADAERLFERFYRADSGTGSGIGLTIARAIVEAHGGRLRAHSAGSGAGATFMLTLPADLGR